jgi:hypothetical protein
MCFASSPLQQAQTGARAIALLMNGLALQVRPDLLIRTRFE